MVGYAPGGGVDTTARIVAAALTEHWGAQVIVENRPIAAGNIATEITAKAAPDGYTLVLCNIGSHSITPARFRARLSDDPIGDFAFPAMIGGVPNVFMVHPSMPVKNLREYIAYAKAHPGMVNFGSSGVGASPHLSIELLKTITHIDIVHVPVQGRGRGTLRRDERAHGILLANLAGGPLGGQSGSAALGVTSAMRNAQLPEVPTFAEQGVKGYDVGVVRALHPVQGTQPIIAKINTDVNSLLAGPVLKKPSRTRASPSAPRRPRLSPRTSRRKRRSGRR